MRSLCVVLAALLLAGCQKELQPGQAVVRRAIPESDLQQALTVALSHDSTAAVGDFDAVRDLMGRPLRVVIDQVDSCRTIFERYAAQNEQVLTRTDLNPIEQEMLLIRPVTEPVSGRCFSYIVRYRLPLSRPLEWGRQRYEAVDLRLAFVHPLQQADLLLKR